jgi:hypothetical protein
MPEPDKWNDYYKPALGVLWSISMLALFIYLTKSLLWASLLLIGVTLVIAFIDSRRPNGIR